MSEELLNFRVGKNIGEILLQISMDKLLSGDILGAQEVYTSSLPGITKDLIIDIYKGSRKLEVDQNGREVELVDSDPSSTCPSWRSAIESKYMKLLDLTDDLGIILQHREFSPGSLSIASLYPGMYDCAIQMIMGSDAIVFPGDSDYTKLYEYIEYLVTSGDDVDCPEEDKEVYYTVEYFKTLKKLCSDLDTFLTVFEFLSDTGIVSYESLDIPMFSQGISRSLWYLKEYIKSAGTSTGGVFADYIETLRARFKKLLYSHHLSKEYMDHGIIESNIMDRYDAGWLSPGGKFYGMTGKVSDFLHLNIAKLLAPKKFYPDQYLESQGWLKVHGQEVYGYFEPPKVPTREQINKVCDYIDKYYSGRFYTSPEILGSRSNPSIYRTYDVRQMDELSLRKIFDQF